MHTRTPRPVFQLTTSISKGYPCEMKARSVNPSSPNLALHISPHTSTKAPIPCGTGQCSFQRSSYPRKQQSTTCSNDRCMMHSSFGIMLLYGFFELSKRHKHTSMYGTDCTASAVIFKVSGSASQEIRWNLYSAMKGSRQEPAVSICCPTKSLMCSTPVLLQGLLDDNKFPPRQEAQT